MKREGLSAVVIAVLAVAGCGKGDVQVHSQTAQQVRLTVSPTCAIEFKTLATATEAYWAMTGGPPSSQGVLVGEGFLLREIDDFDLVVNADQYDLVAAGACTRFDPTVDTVPVMNEPSEELSNCEADLKTLQTAWEAYYAVTGTPRASQEDLVNAGMLRRVSTHFDLVGNEFVAVQGICA